LTGNHVVVGEPGATLDEYESAGKAYVYDTDWNLVTALVSPNPESDAEFGVDVCIFGDLVFVGESNGDVTDGDEGKVYVFDLSGNLLDTVVSLKRETGAQFGFNVLSDGELLIVSEVDATVGEFTGAGKIHVFRLGEYNIEVEEPVEETTTETEEPETEPSGGIPGYPFWSILAALGIYYLIKETAK
jgi:hypothetical protein